MSRNVRRILIALVAMAAVAIPVAASGAVSLWDDVADDNIFVDDTNWMKVTGVSRGCNPPDNTEYCPEDLVDRQAMAAFLHRLSVNEIVNAATAVSAENADNADQLDGYEANEIMSITAAETVEGVTFDPDPSDSTTNPIIIATIQDFVVPTDGGVITAQANVTAEPISGPQLGLVWIQIGGPDACQQPISQPAQAGYFLTLGTIIDTTSTLSTIAVGAGTGDIHLCAATLDTDSTWINAHLSATWVPEESSSGVNLAPASNEKTWQEMLARFDGALDG